MPAFKSKTYNVTKSEQLQRKREERSARKAHAAERRGASYLSEDEHLNSWKIQLNKLGLELRDIPGDGNCLFRALADQLDGDGGRHLRFRSEVCQYITNHQDDFAPFLDDSDVSFDKHISLLRKPGTFAGNDAIVAFARLYKVNIIIHHLDAASFCIDADTSTERELHLTYHNGEHYSSIRRIGDKTSSPAYIKIKPQTLSTDADSKVKEIAQRTGCEDKQFVRESLQDCDGDLDATVEYIISLRLGERGDTFSYSSNGSCSQHSDHSRGASTSTIDSGVCTCDHRSVDSDSKSVDSSSLPQPPTQSTAAQNNTTHKQTSKSQKMSTKSERKKEKKKRAELKHRELKTDANHNNDSNQEIYEVVSQVALLSV